jgi:hypothetical protein
MKFKLKALAAAATMAVAGQASAALSDAFVQNGTLFLTVWDVVTFESYTRDLGVSLNDFLPNSVGGTKTPAGGNLPGEIIGALAPSTLFTNTFSNNTAGNIRWNVIGVDSVEGDGTNDGSRVVSTFANGPIPTFLNGIVRQMASTAVNFAGELVANSGVDFTGAPAEFAIAGNGTQSVEGGGPGWGPNLGTPNNTTGTGFGTAQFWYAATTNDAGGNDTGTVNGVRFGNGAGFATMGLSADGTLTYTLAPEVTAVPLPAAAWLLGAGILGLGSAARRRKAELAAA